MFFTMKKRIVEAAQDETFLGILHNCGRTLPLLESMERTGAAGLSLGNSLKKYCPLNVELKLS